MRLIRLVNSPYRSTREGGREREREREAQFFRSPNISAVRMKLGECRAKTGLQFLTDGVIPVSARLMSSLLRDSVFRLSPQCHPKFRYALYLLHLTNSLFFEEAECKHASPHRSLFLPFFLFEGGERLVQEVGRLGLRRDAHGTILPPQPGRSEEHIAVVFHPRKTKRSKMRSLVCS